VNEWPGVHERFVGKNSRKAQTARRAFLRNSAGVDCSTLRKAMKNVFTLG
jgi:hypothetical protein